MAQNYEIQKQEQLKRVQNHIYRKENIEGIKEVIKNAKASKIFLKD